MRYLTFALAKGRLAKETLKLLLIKLTAVKENHPKLRYTFTIRMLSIYIRYVLESIAGI